MELVYVRNYPGLRFTIAIRRVRVVDGRASIWWSGAWREIAEANYLLWIRPLVRFGRGAI